MGQICNGVSFTLYNFDDHSCIFVHFIFHSSKARKVSLTFFLFVQFFYIQLCFFRTVLLHSERILFIYAFVYACIPFFLDTIRIYFGNLPYFLCWWIKFFRNFSTIGMEFGFTFAFIFRVKL